MNLNFLCCVGAELKNSTTQTTRMPQIYFYRAFEDETIENMLSPGFFDTALGLIRKDDLLLLYDPKNDSVRWVYARVTETDRDGVVVEKMSINGVDVSVDTTGFSELDADNLQTLAEQINSRLSELRGKITQETQDRKDAVQAEADARKAADIVLQNNIDTVSGNLSTHINDKDNPHTVTKAQVGLGNVDNTSDADKPVSDATQTELDKKENTSNKVTTITSSSTNVQYPSAKAAKDYADKAAGLAGNPTGAIISFCGTTAPAGYLKCDGASLSRTTYADLFAVIGTAYTNALYAWTLASADPATVYTASETPAVGDTVYLADGTESTTITAVAEGTITTSVGTYARATASDNTTTFNLPDFSGARFVNSADINNPTVYVGRVGNGNTRFGAHYGNDAGNISGTYCIIVTTYSGNPAYIRGYQSASLGNDYDTQTYIKSENQLSVAPEMLICIKY